MPPYLSSSNLQKKVSSLLVEPYNIMTAFFFRRSVEKAFQLDEPPPELSLDPKKPLGATAPFVTSAVDDVMYVVNQVLQRTLATSQRAVVLNIVPSIARVLSSDFIGMIQRKMRDECYPKAVIQGSLPPEDKIIQFIVLINNLDIANDYIKRIVGAQINSRNSSDDTGAPPLLDLFPFSNDAHLVEKQLKAMEHTFTSKASELLNDGVQVLYHQVNKLRMRQILTDVFRDIDYSLDPDGMDADDAAQQEGEQDLVRARFERGWFALTRPLKRIMTENSFDRLLAETIKFLAKAFENRIWGLYGKVSEIGAVRLERDISGVVNTALSGGKYGLRDMFQRCLQIVMVMNLEQDEWEELAKDGDKEDEGMLWILNDDERRRARGLLKER